MVALALPDLMRMRAHRVLEDLPGWREVVALPDAERRRGDAATPRCAAAARRRSTRPPRGLGGVADWD